MENNSTLDVYDINEDVTVSQTADGSNSVSTSEAIGTVTISASAPTETACVSLMPTPEVAAGIGFYFFTPSTPGAAGSTCTDESGDQGTTVQIIGKCATPAITSILPKTWFAGESYPVTITGTGFTTTANASASCPVTPVTARAGSGSSVALSNVTVVSPTEITATVEPAASDPNGVAEITVGSSSNGGAVSARTQILGNQIKWTQNGATSTISTTDGSTPTPQSAVVGQQIALTTTTPATTAYDGPTLTPTWTAGGTNIGGYTASISGASVTPTTLNQSSMTTYFVYSGSAIPVTYQYCVDIQGASPVLQCSLPANAAFNVTGGGTMFNTPYSYLTIDQLIPCVSGLPPANGGDAAPFMTYGNLIGPACQPIYPPSIFGITFTPSDAPSSGTYTYVQLINSDTRTLNAINCRFRIGVDKTYPYAGILPNTNPPQAIDAPGNPLPDNYTITRSFNATMFLLWTSNLPNSVAVPIGYQNWGFSGTAQQNSTEAWTATTNGTPGPIGGFVLSSVADQTTDGYTTLQNGYPLWSGPATETCN